MLPIERLVHERNRTRTTPAKENRRKRHAFGILPVGVDDRALRSGRGEARVRMRRFASGVGRPFLSFPVNRFGRGGNAGVFPPDVAVRRKRYVGEDAVFREGV